MKNTLLVFIPFLMLLSCNYEDNKEVIINNVENDSIHDSIIVTVLDNVEEKEVILDSSLNIGTDAYFYIYSENGIDSLWSFCNCQKNIKENSIKIQLWTEFPSLSELEKGNRENVYMIEDVPKQYRYLTLNIRDSILEKAEWYMISTEPQFHNKQKDSISLSKYQIKLSTFDYKIAQNVKGRYKIVLPVPFGYNKNDTLITGTFRCNNWTIKRFEELNVMTEKSSVAEE